jgi:signal transduction histidine kinase
VRPGSAAPTGTPDEVRLEVRDRGAGFDVQAAKQNRGLGLVSMRERVHLVHGKFSIESRPGEGTKIIAVVPAFAGNGSSQGPEIMSETASEIGSQ